MYSWWLQPRFGMAGGRNAPAGARSVEDGRFIRALHPDRKARGYSQKAVRRSNSGFISYPSPLARILASRAESYRARPIPQDWSGMRHRPYSLRPRAGRRSSFRRPEKYRGRAERQGSGGPAGLDASRHRGLSKSDNAASPPVPGVPRAVFLGLLRSAPGGRPVSGDPPLLDGGRLSTAAGPGGCPASL